MSPDWPDPPQSPSIEARILDKNLRAQQDDSWEENPQLAEQLGKILFKKRKAYIDGESVAYTASSEETIRVLRVLLNIRNTFLADSDVPRHDDNGDPTVFNDWQRERILEIWKQEYHNRPDQKKLQVRDSWESKKGSPGRGVSKGGGALQPAAKGRAKGAEAKGKYGWRGRDDDQGAKGKGKGKGKGADVKGNYEWGDRNTDQALGPNTDKLRRGKHSRWCRHLQREFGSKALAELIVFTGRVEVEYLRKHTPEDEPPAAEGEPAERDASRDAQQSRHQLKLRVIVAKSRCKAGKWLQKRLQSGRLEESNLYNEDVELLRDLRAGTLLRERNDAVAAFGHGKLVNDRGEELHIGGSTGGRTRRTMGTYTDPDLSAFGYGTAS